MPDELETWVIKTMARRLDCGDCAPELSVFRSISRAKANIFLCTLACAHDRLSCCVKVFTKSTARDVEKLFDRGLQMHPRLVALDVKAPEFLEMNSELQTIVMSFAEGQPLEDLIVRSLHGGTARFETCCDIVARLGNVQSRLASLHVPEHPAFAQPCSNREFTERIAPYLQDAFVADCLADSILEPKRLFDALGSGFWERNEHRVLHGDFQAKNALVTGDGNIEIIDLSYGNGHPLFDAAQFLVQLQRLHRRWLLPGAARRLGTYGDVFLDAFYAGGLSHLKEDLSFFMLWASTFSLLADKSHPWPVRAFIKRHFRSSRLPERWIRR